MRKIVLVLLAVLGLTAFTVDAQRRYVPKVAVYVMGDVDKRDKTIIGSTVVTALTKSEDYSAVERTEEFVRALQAEGDYQAENVREKDLAIIGQQFGVDFVALIKVEEDRRETFIGAEMIDVETGGVINSCTEIGYAGTMQDLRDLAREAAIKLVGLSSNRSSSTSSNSSAEIESNILHAFNSGEYDKCSRLAKQIPNNPFAQYVLGLLYTGALEQNYPEAFRYLRLSAEQGYIDAQKLLGTLYYDGDIGEKNYSQALRWYGLAAEQGDMTSQFMVGNMYYYGLGVDQNYYAAAKWFRLAAEQGHIDAKYVLGVLYINGQGVERNNSEAKKWLRLSAEDGSQAAVNLLNSLN